MTLSGLELLLGTALVAALAGLEALMGQLFRIDLMGGDPGEGDGRGHRPGEPERPNPRPASPRLARRHTLHTRVS